MLDNYNLNIKHLLDRFKIPLALSLLGIVLIIGGIFSSGLEKSRGKEFPKESIVSQEKFILVDVSGAVKVPGVYKLKDGSRIEDAIKEAGGFSQDSNGEYIAKYLNMAMKLTDGSKIFIPMAGENGSAVQGGVVSGANTKDKVNINSASQAEIEALPGIGPVTASKIISGRPYQSIDELLSKKVVSKAIFEKIKDLVVVY